MKANVPPAQRLAMLLTGCLPLVAFGVEDEATVESLKRQLQELRVSFERVQQQHRAQIDALQQQIESLQQAPAASNTTARVASPPSLIPATPAPQTATPVSPPEAGAATATGPATDRWRPTDPIRLGRERAYLDIGLVATFAAGGSTADDIGALQLGGHDPNQRGFTVQGIEMNFAGAIDPYLRGSANILYSIDADGESFLEVEEAWAETASLPWNLQVRAGQLLTEFGRINLQHTHAWAFVDSPLVNARLLGADGLRNPGARLSWLLPLPFYSELFLGVQDSHGETAASFRNDGALNQAPDGSPPFAYRQAANDRGVATASDLLSHRAG